MAKATEAAQLSAAVEKATQQDLDDLDGLTHNGEMQGLSELFAKANLVIPGLYNRTFIKLRLVSCGALAIAAVAHDPFWLAPLVLWTMFLVEVQGAATCIKLLK